MMKWKLALVMAGFFSGYFLGVTQWEIGHETDSLTHRLPASIDQFQKRYVLGIAERVYLGAGRELSFEAKIDSGANVSSIHAKNIHTFSRKNKNGEEELFVKFDTIDDQGKRATLERQVSRVDRVKSASGSHMRVFFSETVWIEGRPHVTEVNLADRTNLSRKFLVGKQLLDQGYLIDTQQRFLAEEELALSKNEP